MEQEHDMELVEEDDMGVVEDRLDGKTRQPRGLRQEQS
jgi:hypothetical protein